jgi:uracil-DNA glycosylase
MNDMKSIQMEPSWKAVLSDEFEKPYFEELAQFLKNEYLASKNTETGAETEKITGDGASKGDTRSSNVGHAAIYPKTKDMFRVFEMCPFGKVKVVILGQDPYHGAGQANGLCFAVNSGIALPPSLKNIFKEIESDLGYAATPDGDLARWAKQGVLLLNSTLTVRASQPGSHQKKGWEEFTDAAIRELSERREKIVFLLWGNYAKQKGAEIDRSKHLVLETTHPSPFSVHNGFFGCRHFSKTNEYLRAHGLGEIDWK